MYSEHLNNSVSDIVTNIEQVKIQSILNGSRSLNDLGIVSSSKPEPPAAPAGGDISKVPDNGDRDEWSSYSKVPWVKSKRVKSWSHLCDASRGDNKCLHVLLKPVLLS